MKNVHILIRNSDSFIIKSFADKEAAERAKAFLVHGSGSCEDNYSIIEVEHSDEVIAKRRSKRPLRQLPSPDSLGQAETWD